MQPINLIVFCVCLFSWLSKTSHVILDEIHERDLHSDFLMIIMKDLVQIRPDIKFVLMSATLNAKMFSSYFGKFIISRGAEGPGREILQRPPSVCLSVCLSVRPSVRPSVRHV